jgi:hypothetical protein
MAVPVILKPRLVVSLWPTVTLIQRESHQESRHYREISQALAAMDEQWGQQEIMDQEQDEIDSEFPPYEEHLCPVERDIRVAYRPYIQTQ